MYVGCLNKTDEGDQENTYERQEHYMLVSTRSVFKLMQTERPSTARSFAYTPAYSCDAADGNRVANTEVQRPKSSRNRLVWARLTGISVCFLSSRRS